MTKQGLIKKIVHWLLAIVTIVFLISGLGITEFRAVEALTFGLLTKSLAFKIHNNLWIPFIIILILHIFLPLLSGSYLKSRKQRNEVVPD